MNECGNDIKVGDRVMRLLCYSNGGSGHPYVQTVTKIVQLIDPDFPEGNVTFLAFWLDDDPGYFERSDIYTKEQIVALFNAVPDKKKED